MKKTLLSIIALSAYFVAQAQQPFKFDSTDFVGAFGKIDWTAGWSNFNPQNNNYPATNATLSGDITTNTTLDASKTYLIDGYVFVKNGATLTIPEGTILRGDLSSKGTLIITKGSKINAQGSVNNPIIFTSNQDIGDRDYGDWGGVIILGKAKVNPTGGVGTIEGGINNTNNDGEYGGTDDNDNSGVFSYVRVEFPGIAIQPNNEINGISLGGVGKGTKFDHVQVSYSGDDAFEWFGGAVDAKYLITYRTWDDDYDCDFGFTGRVQYAFTMRDPAVADISGSNGFEVDNDGTGSSNTPFTAPIFANVTILGPKAFSSTISTEYKRAVHQRRNSRISIFNSVLVGYPTGWYVDAQTTYDQVILGTAEFKNNILACMDKTWDNTGLSASWDQTTFATNTTNNNVENTACTVGYANVSLTTPGVLPTSGSIVWGKQSWSSSIFGTVGPQITGVSTIEKNINAVIYPNPANNSINIEVENGQSFVATLLDLNGRKIKESTRSFDVSTLANGIYLINVITETGSASFKVYVNH